MKKDELCFNNVINQIDKTIKGLKILKDLLKPDGVLKLKRII